MKLQPVDFSVLDKIKQRDVITELERESEMVVSLSEW